MIAGNCLTTCREIEAPPICAVHRRANAFRYECTCSVCGETWQSTVPNSRRNCPGMHTGTMPDVPIVVAPNEGPGTEFAAIAARLGYDACDSCNSLKQGMNIIGVAGCEARFDEVLAAIHDNAAKHPKKWGKLLAAIKAARHGMTFIDPRDPVRSMLREAIRRAASRESQHGG